MLCIKENAMSPLRHFHRQSCSRKIPVDNKLIIKLTEYRLGDSKGELLDSFNEKDIAGLKRLDEKVSLKLLKSNKENFDVKDIKRIRLNNSSTLGNLIKKGDIQELLELSSQLVQYYTFLCKFKEEITYELTTRFLEENKKKIGNTSKNIFILEHKLVLLFNEVGALCEMARDKNESFDNIKQKKDYLSLQLSALKNTVLELVTSSSTNVFFHYLNFLQNYSHAKMSELDYWLSEYDKDKSIADDETFCDEQRDFLNEAKACLNVIEKLHAQNDKELSTQPLGIEYALGRKLFAKLPISNIDSLRDHLADAISA
jgi:hypothetical protein